MAMGPVQVLVIGFGDASNMQGQALAALNKLREQDIVRLVDLLVVEKNADGSIDKVEVTDVAELAELGALAGALIGYGAAGEEGAEAGAEIGAETALEEGSAFDDDEVWYLADAIPDGSVAAIVMLEHRWAIPLRDAIADAGGVALADRWLHPQDLLAAGVEIGMELDA